MSVLIISTFLIGALFNGVYGDCSITRSPECIVELDTQFLCRFGPGMFPGSNQQQNFLYNLTSNLTKKISDPIDCRVYHYCGAGTPDVTYQCPNGFIYNSRLHMCEVAPTNTTDICADRRVDCESLQNVNQMVHYPFHSAYKGFCNIRSSNSTTIIVTPFMMKCQYEDVQEFIWEMQMSCRFLCFSQGYFHNPGNCAEYYYCAGQNADAVTMSCPTKYVFDGTMCTMDQTKCVTQPYF